MAKAANKIPQVGFVSLGCPKATVDSEHILTRLRAEGYGIVGSYQDADLVVVNTCLLGVRNQLQQDFTDISE